MLTFIVRSEKVKQSRNAALSSNNLTLEDNSVPGASLLFLTLSPCDIKLQLRALTRLGKTLFLAKRVDKQKGGKKTSRLKVCAQTKTPSSEQNPEAVAWTDTGKKLIKTSFVQMYFNVFGQKVTIKKGQPGQ